MSSRFSIAWTDSARTDLLAIVDYVVDRDGRGRCRSLTREDRRRRARSGTMPRRCRNRARTRDRGITAYRELLVGPYRVLFAIRDATVVLTTLYGRRGLAELLVERALRHHG